MPIFRILTVGVLMLLTFTLTLAQTPQKNITYKNYVWYGYLSQMRLNDRWGIWFDFHLRTEDLDKNSFWVVRPGIIYRNKVNTMFAGGYANLHSFENIHRIDRGEHRLWQQVQWSNTYPRMHVLHRFRFEQRYREKMLNGQIVEGYNFNHRLRYMFNMSANLNNKKPNESGKISVVVQNEILMNAGEQIIYNYLDQNRLFVGIGYQLTPELHLQLGYMHTFLQQAAPASYVDSNTLRFFVFHQFALPKKEKTIE